MVHRLRCSTACGMFLDQGSNRCPLHWQVDSYPLHHQGSPNGRIFKNIINKVVVNHIIMYLAAEIDVIDGVIQSLFSSR